MRLRLYHYWRSSCSWRVRWALAIKNVPCEWVAVNLLTDEPESPSHRARNPMGYVPALEILDQPHAPVHFLGESVALIEWLEETYPEPSLFPKNPLLKARARQLAEMINSGVQPIQNLNVTQRHSSDPQEQKAWNQHWIRNGLQAYETLVKETSGKYSLGDELSYPDLFLIPQCYNALRNEVDLRDFSLVEKIYKAALETEACKASAPDRFQP